MKKITSIKMRITIWYTSLMLILIAVVLSLVGTLSYRLAINNIEKDIISQVSRISGKLSSMERDVFDIVDRNEEFKNVSIYNNIGEYIVGQYNYDVANIEFKDGSLRWETIGGKEYIIYDILTKNKPYRPEERNSHIEAKPHNEHNARESMGVFWIRGAETVNSVVIFGRAAFLIIIIVIPLILIFAALGGFYITKKAFLPINNILRTAQDISIKSDVKKRIEIAPESKEDELYNLSVTLNQMLDKIENLIRKEKQFTSDASHELRTPVSVILAQGEYLLDIAEDEKERELAENIVAKANQMAELISRLLLISRIDSNRQKFNKEKVDLAVIADIAVESMSVLAENRGISLISEVPENLIVDADETLLLSVFTNLVSNGIKYGKPNGYVRISAKRSGEFTEITVKDNGIGISDEHIDKIWGRFYRVDDVRNDEYGSSGLGLSMVKSIVELHDGAITVKSEPEQGTEFKLVLKNDLK